MDKQNKFRKDKAWLSQWLRQAATKKRPMGKRFFYNKEKISFQASLFEQRSKMFSGLGF